MKKRFLNAGGGADKPARKRRAVNWLNINISAWEVKELRALAECSGIQFRTFLEHALLRVITQSVPIRRPSRQSQARC